MLRVQCFQVEIFQLSVVSCYLPWGRHLKIPLVALVTLSLMDWQFAPFGTPMNLATDASLFSPHVVPMSFSERLDNVITFNSVMRDFNLNIQEQDKYVRKIFGPEYPNLTELHKDVSLVLVNHDSTLSGTRTFPPNVIPVGGLHVVDYNDTLSEVCIIINSKLTC